MIILGFCGSIYTIHEFRLLILSAETMVSLEMHVISKRNNKDD
jgi:hypothetical protein